MQLVFSLSMGGELLILPKCVFDNQMRPLQEFTRQD